MKESNTATKLLIQGIKTPFHRAINNIDDLASVLHVEREAIVGWRIVRRSLDARGNNIPNYVYNCEIILSIAAAKRLLRNSKYKTTKISEDTNDMQPLARGERLLSCPPVVVGAGPAGIFAARLLAEYGFKPIVIERGLAVDERQTQVERFWKRASLNSECNVQFGEGGAGAFSDGKLTARSGDKRKMAINQWLIDAGAPEEIAYLAKPHIGSDKLPQVVRQLRQQIIERGGQYLFANRLSDIIVEDNLLKKIIVNERALDCQTCVLAIGHSARDTYEMLWRRKVAMAVKPFAVGFRIEHLQVMINRSQYGDWASEKEIPAAEYALTWQDKLQNRGVYSFCMCPGGQVIAAASEPHTVVVNGMSNFARDNVNANSAVVVTVGPDDLAGDVLAGIDFQRKLEQAAYYAGGGNYSAPVQNAAAFCGYTKSGLAVAPSYQPGWRECDLRQLLPANLTGVLQKAISSFENKITGFCQQGVLSGIESRTSAPLRILRGENRQSVNVAGLYPTGEGAGYAGGIMSAAWDGYCTAQAIIEEYRPDY